MMKRKTFRLLRSPLSSLQALSIWLLLLLLLLLFPASLLLVLPFSDISSYALDAMKDIPSSLFDNCSPLLDISLLSFDFVGFFSRLQLCFKRTFFLSAGAILHICPIPDPLCSFLNQTYASFPMSLLNHFGFYSFYLNFFSYQWWPTFTHTPFEYCSEKFLEFCDAVKS